MRHTLLGTAMLLVLVAPAFGADDKKKDDKKPDDKNLATKPDYDAVRQAGEATGRVRKLSADDKSFTLSIEYSVPQPKDGNPDSQADSLIRDQQKLLNRQQQILTAHDPVTRQLRLQQLYSDMVRIAAHEQGNIKLVKQHKDFSVQGTDTVQVRVSEPPPKFDDKGNVVPYTPQELKDMKGKGPGYASDFEDLEEGQMVKVNLVKKKKDEKTTEDNLQVATILIVSEAGTDNKAEKKKEEKKKK